MRNTHKTIAESLVTLQEILEIADKSNKVVTYISMGFGNPYGDPWNVEIVGEWTEKLANMGVKNPFASDTVGSSLTEVIDYLFSNLIPKYPNIEFEHIFILRQTNGLKKLMRLTMQVVVVMMAIWFWRLSNGKRRFNRKHAYREIVVVFHHKKEKHKH